MLRTLTFAILASLALPSLFAKQPLPKPPKGFHWQQLAAIQAAILSPDGWNYRSEESGSTKAYFITKDRFDGSGSFKTGFSLNCVQHVSEKSKMKPSDYIDAFTSAADTKHSIIDPKTNSNGPLKMIWFGIISPQAEPNATRMTHFLIANDTTDTVYIIIFEAPLGEWEEAYKSGYVMLKNISVNADF